MTTRALYISSPRIAQISSYAQSRQVPSVKLASAPFKPTR
jgi:hypothetical protein